MKKICLLIVLMFISPIAWAGLNSDFDYMNIPTESFGNIYFRKSTLQEIKTKHPQFKSEKLADGSTILSYKPQTGVYAEIRVGFCQNTLEWIEFILREKQRIDKILSRYGSATEVNRNYNKIYDYYDYEYFNFSVDKQQKFFYSVSVFDNPKLPNEMANFDNELPGLNNLTKIQNFIPGRYIEEAFGDYYESIYPKFNADGSKTYQIKNNITKKYKQAELVFRNGLLKFLVLHPENTDLSQIQSTYGDCVKKTVHGNQIFYDYGSFTVVTDKSNKVLKIAVD